VTMEKPVLTMTIDELYFAIQLFFYMFDLLWIGGYHLENVNFLDKKFITISRRPVTVYGTYGEQP
jgi:hypothetical protein